MTAPAYSLARGVPTEPVVKDASGAGQDELVLQLSRGSGPSRVPTGGLRRRQAFSITYGWQADWTLIWIPCRFPAAAKGAVDEIWSGLLFARRS